MNWKTFSMAFGVGAVVFLIWLALGLSYASGLALYTCLAFAFAGAIIIWVLVYRTVAQPGWPPGDITLAAVLAGLVIPLIAILVGKAMEAPGPRPSAAQPPSASGAQDFANDEAEKPAPEDLLAGEKQHWEEMAREAARKGAGILVTAPEGQVAVKRKEFVLEPDGSGGGRITVMIPPANFIRTKLKIPQGWAFYIATARADDPGRSLKIPGLQVGGIKRRIADGKEYVFWAPVTGDVFAGKSPYRFRYKETMEYGPEAELCFQTSSVTRPMQFSIIVRRSTGPMGPNEFRPGVPLDHRLH